MSEFWETKTLKEMTQAEWESLCDGCARCCVLKEKDDSGEVLYSNRACRFLDLESCRCTCYAERKKIIPECITLSIDNTEPFKWLPSTCAYRLLYEGQKLPSWHPLITGDINSTCDEGMSIRNRVISEDD